MKPVVDVHTHIFNAMDIPLKGYLLSRNAKSLPEKLFGRLLIPAFTKCIRNKLDSNVKMNWFQKLMCAIVSGIVFLILGKQYKAWTNTMSMGVEEITKEMTGTFDSTGVNLYIPLAIDYEYWFVNTPDTPIDKQIDFIYENIVLKSGGKIHPFVPFDPARELAFRHNKNNPDGFPELVGSFKLVKDALENKGFIGVKLYNSLGYKPLNNASVDNLRRSIPLHRKKDIEHSYSDFTGEEYDEVMKELYKYCEQNEIPITAHCLMDGIESYTGASYDFGKAEFWKPVLRMFPKLRLNLAHFGWKEQTTFEDSTSWVKDICAMLKEKNNKGKYINKYLFTDVACHKVTTAIGKKDSLKRFKEINNFLENDIDKKKFKNRLLFGTDWHVLKRVENYPDFKRQYEIVLRDSFWTDKEINNFLGGNAMKFLGILPGGKNRKRLRKFYKKNGIEKPEWYEMTR